MSSAATIYVPLSIGVQNGDFEDNSATPPVGWVGGGYGLNTSYALSYDSTSQYEGQYSLVINASAGLAGISQNLGKVVPGEVYQIGAAMRCDTSNAVAIAQILYFDQFGNIVVGPETGVSYGPSIAVNEVISGSAWVFQYGTGTVPFGAVSMQLQIYCAGADTCEFDAITVTRLSNAIPYYLQLIPSQYQLAANFLQLLAVLLQPIVDAGICAAAINENFVIATATGDQLDALGLILGAPRTLPFAPVGVNTTTTSSVTTGPQPVTTTNTTYIDTVTPLTIDTGGNQEVVVPYLVTPGVGFDATFAKNHSSGVAVTSTPPSAILDDADYQLLLQAKILQNQWDGQADSLWAPWQTLFPGGNIYITDNQNMTCTVFLVGAFTPLIQQMITNGLIVPKPEAVAYIYDFPTLPLFGFGNLNPAFIAGFDIGNWS
jgi:hypothetical protein